MVLLEAKPSTAKLLGLQLPESPSQHTAAVGFFLKNGFLEL